MAVIRSFSGDDGRSSFRGASPHHVPFKRDSAVDGLEQFGKASSRPLDEKSYCR